MFTSIIQHIPYGEKFSRDKIFAVFADLPQTAKISTAKILLTTQTTPLSFEAFSGVLYAVAMYLFLRSNVDKLKLPDPTGSLPTKVPPSYTVLANAGVKSVLKSLLAKRNGLYQTVARCQ